MASYTIFKLKNLSPLHIGTGKDYYDFSSSTLQSDTLASALAAMRAQRGNDGGIKEFMNSFTISSAFPFVGNRYFLPKPQGKISVVVRNKEEHSYRKKLKAVRFIEKSLWNDLINGNAITIEDNQIKKEFLISTANSDDFFEPFTTQVNQRVTVPREDAKDAEPFFFNWTYFNVNAGLYCIIDAEESVIDEIEELLVMLGEFGIGTDKSIGGGKFDIERTQADIVSDAAQPNALVLLSLYIPTEDEVSVLNLTESKYDLVKRSGFMAGSEFNEFKHLRRKSIYMFNVGSLFCTTEKLHGKIVDLRPDWNDDKMHPVYRSGKPFVVPVKLRENE